MILYSMILYIAVTAVCIAAAYFVNTEYSGMNLPSRRVGMCRQKLMNGVALFAISVILTALSALRIGIGNDYWVYRYQFLTIWGNDTPVSYEIGFKYTALALEKIFGFDNYRVVFAFFAVLTVAFMIKGVYENAEWFMYSIFMLLACGYYLMSFDNVRYYLVLAMSLCALSKFCNKRYVAFFIWVLIASLFHKTILLIIPAYFVAYYLKWNKKTLWMIPAATVALIVGKNVIRAFLFKFYPFYEGDLILDRGEISWANIARCVAVLAMALIEYKSVKEDKRLEMWFNLNLFATLLYAFGSYIPEISRVCYYMVVPQIFLVPALIKRCPDKRRRIFWTVSVTAAFIGYFVFFLIKGAGSDVMILPYLSWLYV